MERKGNIALTLVLGGLLLAAVVIAYFFLLKNQTPAVPALPGSKTSPAASAPLKKTYENPFDKKTQYENPFSGYKNPFDSLK